MSSLKLKIFTILLLILSMAVVVYQVVMDKKVPLVQTPITQEENTDTENITEENSDENNVEDVDQIEPKDMFCAQNFQPVCGIFKGEEKTFSSECEAEKAGATEIKDGLCSPIASCPTEKDPVCGTIEGQQKNFDNLCMAEAQGAADIELGSCPVNPNPNPGGVTLCPEMPGPACGLLEGKKTDFENACKAQEAGATEITEGKCPLQASPDLNVAP